MERFQRVSKAQNFPELYATGHFTEVTMSMVIPLFLCLCTERISTDTSYVDGSCTQRTLINLFQHSGSKVLTNTSLVC